MLASGESSVEDERRRGCGAVTSRKPLNKIYLFSYYGLGILALAIIGSIPRMSKNDGLP